MTPAGRRPTRRASAQVSEREQPTFLFVGTVRRLGAATMRGLSKSKERLAIVRVDEPQQGPDALMALAGRDVTVALSRGARLRASDRRLFATVGWIFGEGIALRSLRESLIADRSTRRARAAGLQLTPADLRLREHIADADVVLSGRVIAVRDAEAPVLRAARPGVAPAVHKPISEHDPLWREAVVAVDAVEKGHHPGDQAVVQFPASRDVAWYRVPKLQEGQQGVFLLHKPPVAGRARRLAAAPIPGYALEHPDDFQPQRQLADVRALLTPTPAR